MTIHKKTDHKPQNIPCLDDVMQTAHHVLLQLQAWLPPVPPTTDWRAIAYRWRRKDNTAWLEAIHKIDAIEPVDLLHIERQKEILERHPRKFVPGKPANNVLMTGNSGSG